MGERADHGTATFGTAAAAYDALIGRYAPPLARVLSDFAGVRAGDRALDVGCGPGALTAELVARLGAGHVAAAEPAQGFADACRVRVPGATVVVAAAEALPFADGDFDRVLAQLVVNFLPDAATGLAEMRRVARPGGTVAAAVWDYAGAMTLLRRFWDAAVALDPRAAAHDEAGFALATPEALAVAWAAAGLTDVVTHAAEVEAHYDGFEDLWRPFEAGAGPAAAYAASLPAAARAELADRLRRELGVGDEPFTLAARAWLVRGTS